MIPPKNRIFLALLPKENDSSDAVLDGFTQIWANSEELILQGAIPSGCPSLWIFPGKFPQRGAVPSGRSSFKVLPKKDLFRGANPSKEVPDLSVLLSCRSMLGSLVLLWISREILFTDPSRPRPRRVVLGTKLRIRIRARSNESSIEECKTQGLAHLTELTSYLKISFRRKVISDPLCCAKDRKPIRTI